MVNLRLVYSSRVNWLTQKMVFSFTLCLMLLGVTACDYGNNNSKKPKSPPPFHATQNVPLSEVRKIAKPADGVNTVSLNKQSNSVQSMAYKSEIIFNDKGLSNDARFDRLEKIVQGLSDKFIKLEPTIKRLSRIDNDLDRLASQLEILLKQDKVASSLSVPAPTNKTLEILHTIPVRSPHDIEPAAGVAQEHINKDIQGIRISDHKDKIRIVIDSDMKLDIETRLNGGGDFIVRFLNDDVQSFNPASLKNRSAFIKGISQDTDNSEMSFVLSRSIKRKVVGYIPPGAESSMHRTYIDLKL